MGKLMDTILAPKSEPAGEAHPSEETLAQFADGSLSQEERFSVAKHVNRCSRCYAILAQTLESAQEIQPQVSSHRSKLRVLSLAASILLVVGLGIALIYNSYFLPQDSVQTASIPLDAPLRELMSLGSEDGWDDAERVARLLDLLKERGLNVDKPKKVVQLAMYFPTKSLVLPKEILVVKIEDGVMHLEVIQEKSSGQ